MKCVIPGINIKVFGRAVHSLAKIGDELYVEPSSSGISFRTVNASRSAFACFHFGAGFFSHYDEGTRDTSESEDSVKCKVGMKAFLNPFKSLAVLERNVEKCKLMVDGDEAKLGVQLTCRYGINKTFNLSFIECETLQAVYDKSSCTNHIQSQSRVLSDAFVNFQPNQEEVTICVAEEKTVIRNYVDDEPDPAKAIHTVLTMEAGEFDGYNISSECEVTFCLKELRAVLTFAEPVNLPVASYFSTPGSPIIFVCDNSPVFEANFVLATLAKKSDTQIPRSQSASRQVSQSTQNHLLSGATSSPKSSVANQKSLISESQYPGPSLQESRRSEQISHSSSRIQEEKGNPSLANNHLLNQAPTSCQQKINGENYTNGNSSLLRQNSSIMNRTSPDIDTNDQTLHEESGVVPGTPPAKKTKFFFARCFESTFDPNSIPGNERILAEDSDEDT